MGISGRRSGSRAKLVALACGALMSVSAQAAEPIRIGISTFLSGAGAVFGVPAQHAAQMLADSINASGGIKGAPVELTFIDENRGVDSVVVEYRGLVEGNKVDAMIIGLSSSICLAVAPVAEQLQMPTVLWDCGTARLYEENQYNYVYRTGDYTPSNNVAAALYLLKTNPDIKTIAAINQDYAFGRDNWAAFKDAVKAIRPDINITTELFPRLGTSDYSTEISRLSAQRPDVIFTTLWGGDMNTFVRQANSRSLFKNTILVAPNGEAALQQTGAAFPDNAIVGVRGDSYAFNPVMQNNPQHAKFVQDFYEKTGAYPSFPSYHMVQALQAIQASLQDWNGERSTLKTDLLAGLEGLELNDFTGHLVLREDNQAMEGQLVGTTRSSPDHEFKVIGDIAIIQPELTSPPAGELSHEWIKKLTQDAVQNVQLLP